ncbi:class I SAM-dependent methyltransferase [Candidatus Pacearchaeota archaeon]|nr:class I SAM-dependent methyltransferase [Candidatus Pacearchaeota archaeon]
MDLDKLKKDFYEYLDHDDIWMSPSRLDYSLTHLFRGCNLSGKSVLEIGAGQGHYSAWCVANGADKVVALEPEASGSTTGVQQEFEKMANELNIEEKIEYLGVTFEQYTDTHKQQSYDYILMNAVINHLDEDATKCLHLPKAETERQTYRNIFMQFMEVLKPGGVIIIYDVGRDNFWHALGLKNPFAPTIGYDIHQNPIVWKQLLCQCGFEYVDTLWFTPYRLRHIKRVLSYHIPSYFISSAFILRCKKP